MQVSFNLYKAKNARKDFYSGVFQALSRNFSFSSQKLQSYSSRN